MFMVLSTITSCASVPNYSPVVDTTNIVDREKYAKDLSECEQITNNVDYTDEEVVAGLKGAAVGAGVVGAGVGAGVSPRSHHLWWGTARVSPVLFRSPEGPRHASLYATAGPVARENSGPRAVSVLPRPQGPRLHGWHSLPKCPGTFLRAGV